MFENFVVLNRFFPVFFFFHANSNLQNSRCALVPVVTHTTKRENFSLAIRSVVKIICVGARVLRSLPIANIRPPFLETPDGPI